MKIEDIYFLYLVPALSLLPEKMHSVEAQAMVLAIGWQESGFAARLQYAGGPARSHWQFERIGVAGVMQDTTARFARSLLNRMGYPLSVDAVHEAIAYDGILAAAFARLYLYQHPNALPGRDEIDEGWDQYISIWRPGHPRPEKWLESFTRAWEVVA